jgi:hypothetical protein
VCLARQNAHTRCRSALKRPNTPSPTFRDAVKLSACRGKLWSTKPAALGPLRVGKKRAAAAAADGGRRACVRQDVSADQSKPLSPEITLTQDWSVPQSWFLHFYLTGAAANAAVLWALVRTPAPGDDDAQQQQLATRARSLACLAAFQLHLVRRALETAGLMRYPRGAKMHGVAYLFGMRSVLCG